MYFARPGRMQILNDLSERVAFTLGRLSRNAGTIVLFHSITTDRLPGASSIHVSLEAFRHTLEVARGLGTLVPLTEMIQRHLSGKSTARLFAITFDDAYLALLSEAPDVFLEEQVPTTIFVVTEAAQKGGVFWWDRLEDALPRASEEQWRGLETRCGLPAEWSTPTPELDPMRRWILTEHRGRLSPPLESAVAELEHDVGSTLHRSMTYDELDRLAQAGNVDVGVHTVSHAVLPLLDDREMDDEIRGCAEELQARFDSYVPILAAPYGFFDPRTVRRAKGLGMRATLTVEGRTLRGCGREDGLPRICQLAGQKPWKKILSLSGFKDQVRALSRAPRPQSQLP